MHARRFLVLALLSAAPTLAAPAPAQAAVLFSDAVGGPDRLITNEWAHWNAGGIESPDWEMTSGSLFAAGGAGWTGVPDDCAPDRTSSACTNSAVFRLNTRRFDFSDVRVDLGLRATAWASTASTPAVAWDGVHLWLRYVDEEELYYASVNRRDGAVVVKKKCRGGPSNGGTYVTLGSRSGHPVSLGTWQQVGASVDNGSDGSVVIELFREGTRLLRVVDAGTGCAPIRRTGAVGVRGDNLDFALRDFTVSELHPAVPAPGAPDANGETLTKGSDPFVTSPTGTDGTQRTDGGSTNGPVSTKGSDPFVDTVVLSRAWLRGRALRVRVMPGAGARSVALHLDGRRVAVDRRAPFVLRYRPSPGMRPGIHRLQAIASDGSRSRTLRVRYRR